ncbi:MAG: hypothetical protein ACYTGL_07315 [Planctomycetota bacterium]|jgi:hypothetical protein
MRRLSLTGLWLCLLVVLFWPGAVCAQDQSEQQAAAQESSVNAHEPFVRITQGGLMRYADEAWGTMRATAFNRSDQTVDVNGVAWFSSDPGLQFSRKFQLLPESYRTVWMPVLTPRLPPGREVLDLQWATIRKDGSLVSNRQGERLSDSPIRIPRTRIVVANLSGRSRRQTEVSEVLFNIRNEFGSDVIVNTLAIPPFPANREAWDIATVVVVATDAIADDAAVLNALRLWVQNGGRLWLQLDLISAETVAALLGDVLPFAEVDRTSTVEVRLTPGDLPRPFESETIGFERPLAVTRVVVEPPAAVHQRLDDWPAAFSFPFGSGEVFCTAADISAWFPPRHWRRQDEIADATDARWFDPTIAGSQLLRSSKLQKEPIVSDEALKGYVVSQVGYTTPGRSSVAGLLLGYAVVLALVAFVLRTRQKSGWMLWSLPLLSLVAAWGLVAVGSAARGEPEGHVLGQVVTVESGLTTARVSEALTYYTDDTLPVDETPSTGSPLIPDRAGVGSSRWRVEWTGLDEWALKSVELPPGVRVAENTTHIEFSEPLRAVGTFNESGLSGTLRTPFPIPAEDALIGGLARVTLPASIQSDGSINAANSVLPPGEYMASSLMDGEQTRRQSVYREIFRATDRNRLALDEPHLLFWSKPLTPGSDSTALRDTNGASLFVVPLELQRPAEATEVLVPGTFLPYEVVPMTKSGGIPSYFQNRLATWTESRSASRALLRFQVPHALLPIEPLDASLTIRLSAGSRPVTLQAGLPNALTTIREFDSPVGTFEVSLESESQLRLDDQGGLHVLLEVGDVQTDEDRTTGSSGLVESVRDEYWKVDWMHMTLRARTIE